jgi:hypothetical protein
LPFFYQNHYLADFNRNIFQAALGAVSAVAIDAQSAYTNPKK